MNLAFSLSVGSVLFRVSGTTPTPTPTPSTQPTAFAGLTPTVQYHPHTSDMTIHHGTFQGYMPAGSSKLTVTALDTATCSPLRDEVPISGPGVPEGATVKKAWTKGGGTIGNGKTGDYEMSFTAGTAIGSVGSPATFTVLEDRVMVLGDLMGNADLSAYTSSSGPILMTDGEGVKCLLFNNFGGSVDAWLRNLDLGGIDASNMSWWIVARVLTPPLGDTINNAGSGYYLLSIGANELGNYNASFSNFIRTTNGTHGVSWLGPQKQVIGRTVVTDDGVGGTSTSTAIRRSRVYLNTEAVDLGTAGANGRANNMTGFCFNSIASSNGGQSAQLIVYEIVGFLEGQMGDRAAMPAIADAAAAALVDNHDIPAITKNLLIFGDSRLSYGYASYSNYLTDGSGRNIATFLTDPGGEFCVPKDVRVLTLAMPGRGIDVVNSLLDSTGAGSSFNRASPTAVSKMMGGGNDYFIAMLGANDRGNWPNDSWGGVATIGTTALGDDLYAGEYTATFTATIADGTRAVTITDKVGVVGPGSVIVPENGWVTGLGVVSMVPGNQSPTPTTLNTMSYQSPAKTGVAATALMRGYKSIAQALVDRGFKGLWLSEVRSGSSLPPDTAALTGHVLTDMVGDVGAGPGQAHEGALRVADPSLIEVGGQRVLGPDWTGANGDYYVDLIHLSTAGKRRLFDGGDTPQHGIGYQVQQLLAEG